MNNIILIGFMGVGKTEVGKLLAKELKMTYLDTDSVIGTRQGRSIGDIFAKDGEQAFREMETNVLEELKEVKNHVISTGGGMILRPENVKMMKALGPVILLSADPGTVHERLKSLKDRPLLDVPDPRGRIKEILDFRMPIYKKIAEFEVDTSRLSPNDACNRIIGYLRKAK